MAGLLEEAAIQERLKALPNWKRQGNSIACTRKFQGFVEAISFVNKLVDPAEAAGHHPDLSVSYNTVTIELTSHDAGGLTEQDFEMAKTISQIE